MNFVILGSTLLQWIYALVVSALLFGLLQFARRVLYVRLDKLAKKTHTVVDDMLLGGIGGTRFIFIVTLALYGGLRMLTLSPVLADVIHNAVITVFYLQLGFWGAGVVTHAIAHRIETSLQEDARAATTLNALGVLSKIVIWTVVTLLVLENLTGMQIYTLIASLGVGGIAVGLAVQKILGDLFASLTITLDKPFVIGDFIQVDTLSGTVEKIGLKSTRVRSLTGETLIFSNSDLLDSRLRNYKGLESRRVAFTVGVTYKTTPEQLAQIPQIFREIIEPFERVRFDRAHFKAFGLSSLDFEIVYFIDDQNYAYYMDVQQAINLALLKKFNEQGIEFAWPTQTVYLTGAVAGESAPPDRRS